MGKGRGPRKSPGASPPRPQQLLADTRLAPQTPGGRAPKSSLRSSPDVRGDPAASAAAGFPVRHRCSVGRRRISADSGPKVPAGVAQGFPMRPPAAGAPTPSPRCLRLRVSTSRAWPNGGKPPRARRTLVPDPSRGTRRRRHASEASGGRSARSGLSPLSPCQSRGSGPLAPPRGPSTCGRLAASGARGPEWQVQTRAPRSEATSVFSGGDPAARPSGRRERERGPAGLRASLPLSAPACGARSLPASSRCPGRSEQSGCAAARRFLTCVRGRAPRLSFSPCSAPHPRA